MEKPLSGILSAIPPKPPRSKLEPHYDLIRELRRCSRTYHEIAKILQDHVGLKVDHTTIRDFVHLRARWAKKPRRGEQLPPRTLTKESTLSGSGRDSPMPALTNSVPPDGAADAYSRIEALKRRKATLKPADPGFHFEEGAPLRLVNDPK
jgi:hypothetical protein